MHNRISLRAHQYLAAEGAVAVAVEVLGVHEQQRGAATPQRNVPRLQAASQRVSISEQQPVSQSGPVFLRGSKVQCQT